MILRLKPLVFGLFCGLALSQTVAAQDEAISTRSKRIAQQIVSVPMLADAPASDFERVAWCHGILSGHMEIAERIKDEDPVMRTIGKSYLKTYEAALSLSEAGKTDAGRALGEKARMAGNKSWDEARAADIARQTGAYLNWSLPGDCERATLAISGHPDLFAEMADEDEAQIINKTLASGDTKGAKSVLTLNIPAKSTVKAKTKPQSKTRSLQSKTGKTQAKKPSQTLDPTHN
jgi:hypothetical protein